MYIIQECENPETCSSSAYNNWAVNYLWIGDNKNKGLGIFANKHVNLISLSWTDTYKDHKVKHFLPCLVNNAFTLLAVWTHQNNSPNFGYIGQFWKYLQLHKRKLQHIIIAGDFNSNSRWDEWDRWWNHSDVVKELLDIGIESLYHSYYKEAQGKETQPTFYKHRNLQKPYHIDYCFASAAFVQQLKNVTIEPYDKWMHLSDHSPLIITLSETNAF